MKITNDQKAAALKEMEIAYRGNTELKSYYWRESVEQMCNDWFDEHMDLIRALLQPAPDLEALKKSQPSAEAIREGYEPEGGFEYTQGWNDCIDAVSNLLNLSDAPPDGLKEKE